MEKLTNCPNCKAKLKGMISTTKMFNETQLNFVKSFGGFNGTTLCEKCGTDFFKKSKVNYSEMKKKITKEVKSYYRSFPILTIQPPTQWNFDVLGLITAQTSQTNKVKNTSILEIIFDANRNVVDLDNSANMGELICMEVLRQKTYALGGNAIVGIDLDYMEFGLKGELMLMCIAGTAINIKELDKVNSKISEAKNRFSDYSEKVDLISKYSTIAN